VEFTDTDLVAIQELIHPPKELLQGLQDGNLHEIWDQHIKVRRAHQAALRLNVSKEKYYYS
jgi:hypothetical protein